MPSFPTSFPRKSSQKKTFSTLGDVANFTEWKTVFPLKNRCYHLLLTIPVTVAKDERTFSRLKIVKTPLRTTMGDQRLESLLLISCENDFTESIDFECVARDWADLKTRRINCPQS